MSKPGKTIKPYIVIALYLDNMQWFAETYRATSPENAEKKATVRAARRGEGTLVVAGVIEVVDGKAVVVA